MNHQDLNKYIIELKKISHQNESRRLCNYDYGIGVIYCISVGL